MESPQESSNSTLVKWSGNRKHALADPEDDWAGLGDPKERRKRQNRINQRAFRESFRFLGSWRLCCTDES